MKNDEALRIAVEALEQFQLGHEHAPDLPHTRKMGDDYGWCDYCHAKVSWGRGVAEEALDKIAAIKLAEERAQEAPKTERKSTTELAKGIVEWMLTYNFKPHVSDMDKIAVIERIKAALDAERAAVAKELHQAKAEWHEEKKHNLEREEARKHETGSEVRPVVAWFAQQMEKKLRANDHKPGWREHAPRLLLNRLREELKELEEDVSVLEAVDVANFAMMIADNVDPHRFKRHQAEPQPPAPGPSPAGGEDRCVTCGSRVRVVGHTTKHYEPIEAGGEFPSEIARLIEWAQVNLDAPTTECRGDEDCDHCEGLRILDEIRALKSRLQAPGPAQPPKEKKSTPKHKPESKGAAYSSTKLVEEIVEKHLSRDFEDDDEFKRRFAFVEEISALLDERFLTVDLYRKGFDDGVDDSICLHNEILSEVKKRRSAERASDGLVGGEK